MSILSEINYQINIINQIPDRIEKYIIKKLDKKAPQSYGIITDDELDKVSLSVYNRYGLSYLGNNEAYDTNIKTLKNIIASLKSAYMKNHIIKKHYRINKYSKLILNLYSVNKSVLKISAKYDLSPLTILRYIFEHKYKKKFKELYYDQNLLNQHDQIQLKLAIQSDIYNTPDQVSVSKESVEFENRIEGILNKYNIKYKTQKELSDEQIIKYGKAINTPDFLILSDIKINDHQIKWIDAKKFLWFKSYRY